MRAIHYFSPWLKSLKKYQKVWWQIESALDAENELYDFVPNASDIWVRDFMPFQRHDEEFVIYRYNPDYLQGKYSRYITNCRDAFLEAGGSEVLSSIKGYFSDNIRLISLMRIWWAGAAMSPWL